MKKNILEKLAKETLYSLYNELKYNLSGNILKEVQFIDELPSINLWNSYISKSETSIIFFKNDLINPNFYYFDTTDEAKRKLVDFLDRSEVYLLFSNRNNSILFWKKNIFDILDSLYFFDNEDLLLYGIDSKVIITGGNGGIGFVTWSHK